MQLSACIRVFAGVLRAGVRAGRRCLAVCCSCVSVCLAGVFLILGVDILEDKGPR